MALDFRFPDVGEGITEGEIVKWLVKEGDKVKEHETIAKIETDKAIVEIPAPQAGTILKIYHKQGDTVKVGEVLVTIGSPGEKVSAPKAQAAAYTSSVVGFLEEATDEMPNKTKVAQAGTAKEFGHALATPATRRLARELKVDIEKVKGTGLGGRVTEEDVRKAGAEGSRGLQGRGGGPARVVLKYDLYGHVDRVPLRGVRKAIAENMVKSAKAPHVTHFDEADITDLFELREKEKIKAKKQKVHLTFLPYITKACIAALKKHPSLNASMDDEHQEIVIKKYFNIGIAVDTPEGLIVPVVKIADEKTLYEIAKEIEELAEKAENRKIDLGDLKGNSFTITNIGVIGGIFGTPIINPDDVAILATGKIQDKPVVQNGKIVVRKILPLSLSFDHRVLDGAEAARFVNDLKEILAKPTSLK